MTATYSKGLWQISCDASFVYGHKLNQLFVFIVASTWFLLVVNIIMGLSDNQQWPGTKLDKLAGTCHKFCNV